MDDKYYKKISFFRFAVSQSDNPHINFKKDVYVAGEILEANCTSAPANPVPHLTWFINGNEVTKSDYYTNK